MIFKGAALAPAGLGERQRSGAALAHRLGEGSRRDQDPSPPRPPAPEGFLPSKVSSRRALTPSPGCGCHCCNTTHHTIPPGFFRCAHRPLRTPALFFTFHCRRICVLLDFYSSGQGSLLSDPTFYQQPKSPCFHFHPLLHAKRSWK